jgi:hypothetical protein
MGMAVLVLRVAADPRIATAADPARVLRSERLNGTFRDLAVDLAPVQQGNMTLSLSSPVNAVTLHDHQLRLEPDGGEGHRVAVTVELSAEGDLVADVSFGGPTRRLRDRLVVPRQRKTLTGRVLLAETDGGFLVTVLEAPRQLEITVESGLADQVSGTCASLVRLPLLKGLCAGLGAALEHLWIPLPEAGHSYLVPAAELTPDERRQLRGYLAKTGSQGEGGGRPR